MFQETTAWFSSSVDRTYIDLWIKHGGRVEDKYKDDKLPEYLFSCDPEEHDTQRLIRHISYIVIHPEWIFDTIIDKKRKSFEQYLLLNNDFQDTNINRIASATRMNDNNKSNKKTDSNGPDILADLASHDQVNDDFIIAYSPSIPNKYYLPRRRSRKVSKGKNPVQDNNIKQSMATETMSTCDNNESQDIRLQIDSISSDLQSDTQTEESARSTVNSEDLGGNPRTRRDRPRTLPDFMSKKRPKVVLTGVSDDDSFFSDDEDSSKKRKRTNYIRNPARIPPTGKKAPSLRCECGRSVQPTMSVKQLLSKDSSKNVNKESRSITSIRLQHISIRSLLEKVLKYLRVVKGSNSSLMGDVYEFTPGRNGFSARMKSTLNSRATSTNPRVQTRGKSSFRKT